jgi:hypothetical protein
MIVSLTGVAVLIQSPGRKKEAAEGLTSTAWQRGGNPHPRPTISDEDSSLSPRCQAQRSALSPLKWRRHGSLLGWPILSPRTTRAPSSNGKRAVPKGFLRATGR